MRKIQPVYVRTPFDHSSFFRVQEKDVPIAKLPVDSFDWQRWRLGVVIWRELGIACRRDDIHEQAKVLRKYAVGYLAGEKLFCRPKQNEVAVMFLIDDEFCWTHLRKEEFENVFGI